MADDGTEQILDALKILGLHFGKMDAKVDEIARNLDEQRKETAAGFDRVERRLGHIETRVESLETDMRGLKTEVSGIAQDHAARISALESR